MYPGVFSSFCYDYVIFSLGIRVCQLLVYPKYWNGVVPFGGGTTVGFFPIFLKNSQNSSPMALHTSTVVCPIVDVLTDSAEFIY